MSQNYEWDLSALAASDTDKNLEQANNKSRQAVEAFRDKWLRSSKYLSDAKVLRTALQEFENILRDHGFNGRSWYYFQLRSAQNQSDAALKGLQRQVDAESTELYNLIQFFPINLSKISAQQLNIFKDSEELKPFMHYLQRLYNQQSHVLSNEEEAVINLLSSPARNAWISMTSTFLAKESYESKDIFTETDDRSKKNFSEIISLTSHPTQEVRDNAARLVDSTMSRYVDIATEELNAILDYKKITDQLRGYSRPDQSRLQSDDIEPEVVDALIASVSDKFSISRDYYSLKATLMHKDALEYHERNVPYGSLEQEYSYDKSVALVHTTLAKLDPEFGIIYKRFIDANQFDVYPREGKVGGAFCAHHLISQPTYILLNHTNKLQDVLTIAHEMGHGLHNELAREKQSALYFGTSLATAEVSSTFMEDFVLRELLDGADKQTQLAVKMMKLNDDISSIFRQIACYRFEQELHEQFRKSGYIDSQTIGEIFARHMASYMGDAVKTSDSSQHWWVYWSHIRNHFYVYSYASGLLISKSLQALVHQNAENIGKVKEFMQAGESASPSAIFASIGLDITDSSFWLRGLKEVETLLFETTELAEELSLL